MHGIEFLVKQLDRCRTPQWTGRVGFPTVRSVDALAVIGNGQAANTAFTRLMMRVVPPSACIGCVCDAGPPRS